jgi:hypothetical protein
MTSKLSQICVPSSVGPAALEEVDRVLWAELEHAYGTGRIGPQLHQDVAATLRKLGDRKPGAFEEGVEALFGNLCHQGTIYRSTAFGVPFLAAFAAGTDFTPNQSVTFVAIFASIGIAASYKASHGSHAGSYGPGVGPLTRQALRVSRDHLAAAAQRNPGLHETVVALAALVRADAPDPSAVGRLEAVLSDLHYPVS